MTRMYAGSHVAQAITEASVVSLSLIVFGLHSIRLASPSPNRYALANEVL